MNGNRAIGDTMTTDIPARLDRLPWSRFHLLVVFALGITWVLDGLEVTIVGGMGGVLQDEATLHLTGTEIGSIASAYIVGAVVGAIGSGWLASAAASAAYLSAGELFPLKIRALVIAVFYAVGTGVGGAIGPYLFARLIDVGSRFALFDGYLLAAGLMATAAGTELVLGIDAERRSLESVADPLSARPQ